MPAAPSWRWASQPWRSIRAGTGRVGSTKAWCRCRFCVVELDPFAGLSAVLGAAPVHVDPHRQARKGVPEIVYAAGKPHVLTVQAVRDLLARQPSGRVLVSRASPEAIDLLHSELEPAGVRLQLAPSG